MARLIITDDHPMIREALCSRLQALGFEVVGEAGSGEELLTLIKSQDCELILLDISMPGMNGLEAAQRIKALNPCQKILILSTHDRRDYVHAVRVLGIDGYLLKSVDLDEMKRALDVVLMGGLYFSEPVKVKLARGPDDALDELTGRERRVLTLMNQGLRSKEIAAQLNISIRTVEAHRLNLNRKLTKKQDLWTIGNDKRFGEQTKAHKDT